MCPYTKKLYISNYYSISSVNYDTAILCIIVCTSPSVPIFFFFIHKIPRNTTSQKPPKKLFGLRAKRVDTL